MAYNKFSPQEFIQQTFPSMVAVMCTPGVETSCRKNNLNFVEMIRPFSKATIDGSLRDPTGTAIPVRNLRVSFLDINSRPPPLPIARSYFNDVINSNMHDRTVEVINGEDKLDVPVSVPWFDAWRNTFLQVQYPSDHEFTKHYVACLLVVSSEDDNPLDKMNRMMANVQDLIHQGASKLPKWFTPSSFVLITHLLLHDNTCGDSSACLPLMEDMKSTYGSNKCFFLSINSQASLDNMSHLPDPWAQFLLTSISYKEEPKDTEQIAGVEFAHELEEKSSPSTPFIVHPLSPVTDEGSHSTYASEQFADKSANLQHGRLLTAEDINRIKQFINEFCLKALLPHFEKCIQTLSDQVSNKKGMSRSLFSATKRWFGTSKPGAPGNNISPTAIAYSSDSHELQLRRLGDLAFMIGHYLLAYTAYHGAKRDFSADGAWLHYAGALEMAALSAFMSANDALARKVIDYAEESITTYQTSCRVNQFATRATLLSVECLKGKGLYGEAAKQLIRMSGEDSDLRSAVLLEQAAYSFLSSRKPSMHRKYAFHMVLAGHRFNKAGHKNHSMRCYYQAYQLYAGKSWSVAEDHILYTIGKQAFQLKLTTDAIEALSRLVKRSSRQTSQQQLIYLQEYMTTLKQMIQDEGEGILSLPVIDLLTIQVLLNISVYKPPSSNMVPASSVAYNSPEPVQQYVENPMWWKMEEKLVNYIEGGFSTMVFKPTVEILTYKTDNSNTSFVVAGEPIGICVNFRNPLHVAIKICSLCLMWSMKPEGSNTCQDNFQNENAAIAESVPDFTLEPDSSKNVMLLVTPECLGEFQVTGLSYTLTDSEVSYSVSGNQPLLLPDHSSQDKRLQFMIIENGPQLQVCFSGLRRHIFSSEIVPLNIYLENTGHIGISRIFIMSGSSFSFWIEGNNSNSEMDIFMVPMNQVLAPGQKLDVPVFIYPHFKDSTKCLELLFYYESVLENSIPRYRLVRHNWPTTSHSLFQITTISSKSHSLQFKEEAINIRMHIEINTSENAPHPLFKLAVECISLYCPSWKLISKSFTPVDFIVSKEESVYILLQAVKGRYLREPLSSVHFTSETESLPYKFCLPSLECKVSNQQDSLIYCIINWRTDTSDEYGIHSVQGQECIQINTLSNQQPSVSSSFTPTTLTIFGDAQADECSHLKKLIYYQLQHLPAVNHNFLKNRLCTVPVTLWLHNSSDDVLFVKVDLVTLPKDTSEAGNMPECFAWVGRTEFSKEIKGLERSSVLLKAAFAAPGSYDLTSRIAILVRVREEMILQSCQIEASVIVS